MRLIALLCVGPMIAFSAPAAADDQSDIRKLEERWGAAFLSGDRAFLHSILAPEFKLMRAEGGRGSFTPRARWLSNLPLYTFHTYDVRVTDVIVAGKTAVATVEGRWKVTFKGRGTREEPFILSDTWVKRDGRWRVVYRHSTPGPALPAP